MSWPEVRVEGRPSCALNVAPPSDPPPHLPQGGRSAVSERPATGKSPPRGEMSGRQRGCCSSKSERLDGISAFSLALASRPARQPVRISIVVRCAPSPLATGTSPTSPHPRHGHPPDPVPNSRQPHIGRDGVEAERPPPSTTTETFGPSRRSSRRRRCRRGCASASGLGSAISSGSSPASGPVCDRHAGAHRDAQRVDLGREQPRPTAVVRPRICKLPRAVTSTMPLPCRAPRSQSPIKWLRRQTSSDRVEPHQQAVAGLHRRRQRRAGAAAVNRRQAARSAFMPPPPAPAPRRSGRRDRRRSNCAAGATARDGAPTEALGDESSRRPDFRAG